MILTDEQVRILRAFLRAVSDADPWGDVGEYLPSDISLDDCNKVAVAIGAFEEISE